MGLNLNTTGVSGGLNVPVILQDALIEFRQNVVLVGKTTQAQGAQAIDTTTYRVNIIVGGVASSRAPDASVTDTTNSISTVELATTEYEYSIVVDNTFMDYQSGRFLQDFIRNGARALAQKVEKRMAEVMATAVTSQATIGVPSTATNGANMVFETFQTAMQKQGAAGAYRDGMCMATNWTQWNSIMNETEFAEFNTSGIANQLSTGQPGPRLYSYMPSITENLYTGGTFVGETFDLNGAIASTTATSVPFDALSTASAIGPGSVFLVGTEQMLVQAVSFATTTTGTLTVVRGVNGSTAATHADNATATIVSRPINMFWHPMDVYHIYAAQNVGNYLGNTGTVKIPGSMDGVNMYFLTEAVPGKNGAIRLTLSTRFGGVVPRPIALVKAPTAT